MILETTIKLSDSKDLSYDEMRDTMNEILMGKTSIQDTTNFLKNLTIKGESNDELLAMLDTMQKHAIHIEPKCNGRIIDVCGTGGDKLSTFNVSTTASFVIAAGGGKVAKHGNRSTSGISGSADIFEYFGYDLNMEPNKIKNIIERFNIGFMFAQKFHPAMKNVAEARKILGTRTAFNLLGPLSNPAQVKNQLVGVFAPVYLQRIITLLQSRGAENVMTVISDDGLDELSITSKNYIHHLKNNEVHNFVLEPSEMGLTKASLSDIQIHTKDEAIRSFVSVLNGTGKKSMIEVTALNAAAGFDGMRHFR
ncbi:Anthranilate phosphoribosyltransferase [Candidatus Nitrosotalea sp. TS]|uniref:anthranilate phosphoribosyltransferase n=1 Tax=Candidatus Nitrosotalea sp. TS TaxID=2341020 RepID=UPI001EB795C9|nr:anthranilate phosphoribosyltransferase [Candidatus Nitrosotalea sp. TS]NHI02900.1 Anthranilate phosphoribosyltransferase [Candidatus Nitrosotalea sp. TS]